MYCNLWRSRTRQNRSAYLYGSTPKVSWGVLRVRGAMIRQRPQRALGPSDPRRRGTAKHGLSATDLQLMLAAQDDRCAICGADVGSIGAANVDHDHVLAATHPHPVERGCVRCRRSILCRACNLALGYFDDDPARLRVAAGYVEKWRERR